MLYEQTEESEDNSCQGEGGVYTSSLSGYDRGQGSGAYSPRLALWSLPW